MGCYSMIWALRLRLRPISLLSYHCFVWHFVVHARIDYSYLNSSLSLLDYALVSHISPVLCLPQYIRLWLARLRSVK